MKRIQAYNALLERLTSGALQHDRSKSQAFDGPAACETPDTFDGIAHDIDVLIESFWSNHDNQSVMSLSVDLEDLSAFHSHLIESASSHILNDYSTVNEQLLRTHRSAREALTCAEDGKSADGIVLFSAPRTYYLVGDIHSDYCSLKRVFKTTAFFETMYDDNPCHLIFLGDYVDRGKAHLKTMEYLLIMKALFPNRITLLRGNHDGGVLTDSGISLLPYRIPETEAPLDYFPRYLEGLSASNPSFSKDVLPGYLAFFDVLPYIAFVKTGELVVECVHGGLPKPVANKAPAKGPLYGHLKCLSDLTQHPELDNAGTTICQNIMWSDPQRDKEDLLLSGKRFKYSAAHYNSYSKYFQIDTLYRGHEVVEDGIRSHFEDKVFTVFSSGNSFDSYYATVTPKIVLLKPNGETQFLTLKDSC